MLKTSSLFLFWVTLLAVFIVATSIGVKTSLPGQSFQIMFIPVAAYLIYTLVNHFRLSTPVFNLPPGWKRPVVYYCFVVTLTLVAVGFLSARTPDQIVSSLIFAPVAVYFFWLVWPRSSQALSFSPASQPQTQNEEEPKTDLDTDRRDFLKLLGTAGVSIFLYNLFLRRSGASLFSPSPAPAGPLTLQNAQGEVINPAEKSPTQGYYIHQIDDSAISYFGFLNHLGQWFVMRQEPDGSFRYVKGDKDFSANWENRAKLTYDYFDNVF